jgi:hypothetical protein
VPTFTLRTTSAPIGGTQPTFDEAMKAAVRQVRHTGNTPYHVTEKGWARFALPTLHSVTRVLRDAD